PDPEVFLIAAQRMGVSAENCIVVEDAHAGIEAALAAGMKTLAVGTAYDDKRADSRAKDIASVTTEQMKALF
ncbi:unnamed protein product, partial [marine sediment metagenome]